ncbi:patatin-like protein 2 [Syzygium oleosum]|uniref:patatin-like protein 2 n=1 Tax=Syzygium oleosum TaxID=219896 RepID=UPI0024BA977F|nr:patatin-like protein 2 [Syzygium oleosum]
MFDRGSKVMVEQNLPTAIETLHAKDHYFRIQDDTLCGDLSSMDKATRKNLDDLVKFSDELLVKPVSKRNPNTGVLEPCSRETNAEALIRLAKLLSEGRKRRPAPIRD